MANVVIVGIGKAVFTVAAAAVIGYFKGRYDEREEKDKKDYN